MSTLLKDKGGQVSSTRVVFMINTVVAVALSFYCIYMKQLTWEAVALIGTFLGVTNVVKAVTKKMETGTGAKKRP